MKLVQVLPLGASGRHSELSFRRRKFCFFKLLSVQMLHLSTVNLLQIDFEPRLEQACCCLQPFITE